MGYRSKLRFSLLRLLTKKCKHFFVSLHYAEPIFANAKIWVLGRQSHSKIKRGQKTSFYLGGESGMVADATLTSEPGFKSHTSHKEDKTPRLQREVFSPGGESGIRTHGTLPHAGFQDRCLQPLGHLSINNHHILTDFYQKSDVLHKNMVKLVNMEEYPRG